MSLHFTHGVTPYGSPDHNVAWFAILEDWLVNTVGWTVVSGAGSQNIVFTSPGESGTLTKLFVNIRTVGSSVYGDVWDDAVGTHKTTQLNPCLVPAARQIEYWFTADLDTIIFIVPFTVNEYVKYLGLLEPLALNPGDETEYMVASSNTMGGAAILHHHTGAWDVNVTNAVRAEANQINRSLISREFSPPSIYADTGSAIAGQYKYLSSGIGSFSVTPRDKVTSTVTGGTAEWEAFMAGGGIFFLQTAGAAPGDVADGAHFAYQTGVEANQGNFLSVTLPAFMTAIGWTDEGSPGEYTTDRLFHSVGEDGTRDIWILIGFQINGNPYWYLRVYDDTLGTHKSQFCSTLWMAGNWPGTYHLAADRDCLCMTWEDTLAARQGLQWIGMAEPVSPGIASSFYLSGAHSMVPMNSAILRTQEDVWGAGGSVWWGGVIGAGSSPNLYDGTTYVLWPYFLGCVISGAGSPRSGSGWMKYAMFIDGAPLAVADTITYGAEVYQVFNDGVKFWAMRIS